MTSNIRRVSAILTGAALALMAASLTFATDFTSEISDMGTTVLGNVTTNAPAIVAAGLLVFGALASIGIVFKALRKTPAKG